MGTEATAFAHFPFCFVCFVVYCYNYLFIRDWECR